MSAITIALYLGLFFIVAVWADNIETIPISNNLIILFIITIPYSLNKYLLFVSSGEKNSSTHSITFSISNSLQLNTSK